MRVLRAAVAGAAALATVAGCGSSVQPHVATSTRHPGREAHRESQGPLSAAVPAGWKVVHAPAPVCGGCPGHVLCLHGLSDRSRRLYGSRWNPDGLRDSYLLRRACQPGLRRRSSDRHSRWASQPARQRGLRYRPHWRECPPGSGFCGGCSPNPVVCRANQRDLLTPRGGARFSAEQCASGPFRAGPFAAVSSTPVHQLGGGGAQPGGSNKSHFVVPQPIDLAPSIASRMMSA